MEGIENYQARVNVTYAGANGDLPDPVSFDATDGDVKQWVTEAIHGGGVPGIGVHADADFTDFVVDRFAATAERPWNAIFLRPKTPFGFLVDSKYSIWYPSAVYTNCGIYDRLRTGENHNDRSRERLHCCPGKGHSSG